MSFTAKSLIIGLLASAVVAAPATSPSKANLAKRQMTIPSCYTSDEYSDLNQEEPYYESPVRVSGYQCESTKNSGCSLGKSATHTVGVTKTVSGGLSDGFDLGKVFSLGTDAGFSYSWSTSDATSANENSECPEGGVTCGLQVSAKVVKITGHLKRSYRGGCDRVDEGDFEIIAPVEVNGDNSDQKAVQTFSICLAEECDSDECKDAVSKSGMDTCP